ncbi:MAG TPA: hypothetical protein VNN73_23690 [Blastocatellia bacterium]|nr:hypothetical protein [Blastocatellia bacterium]
MKRKWHWALTIMICAGMGIAVKAYMIESPAESEPRAAQDVVTLDRRISSLEQRLYLIESNISRLEQQMLLSRSAPTQSVRDPEITLLRSEVEALKARARELECGLVHLDERTLSASAKEARRRAGVQSKDPCRLNSDAPVQLSTRP